MTDVEELLRETLTDARHRLDPVAGMYETVQQRVRERRRRRVAFASAAAAAVAVVVAGSVVGFQQSNHHRTTPLASPTVSPTTGPGPSLPPHGTTGQPLELSAGFGTVDALVTTADALYVLTSNGSTSTVIALSPTGGREKATAPGPTGTPTGLTVGDGRVFAWSQDTKAGISHVNAYDERTLKAVNNLSTTDLVNNAVTVDGDLYLATSSGLVHQRGGAGSGDLGPQGGRISGISGFTYGLAADPARHRVIVGVSGQGGWGAQVDAVDTRTGKVTHGPQTQLGKESIAVVGNDIWVGGYASGDTKRLMHLDASTLQVIGSSPLSAMLGPGAVVWPGQHVLWVSAGGDAALSCLDPKTGSVLADWNAASGPVTSVGGSAYATNPYVVPLVLTGACVG